MENGLPGRTRWLDVAPGRLPGWLESFADRHGGLSWTTPVPQPRHSRMRTPATRPADGSGSAERGVLGWSAEGGSLGRGVPRRRRRHRRMPHPVPAPARRPRPRYAQSAAE